MPERSLPESVKQFVDKFNVLLQKHAKRDLEELFQYIAVEAAEPDIALSVLDALEKAMDSLEEMPYRYPETAWGKYAYKGYRSFSVKKYCIIYKVYPSLKQVRIVSIIHTSMVF